MMSTDIILQLLSLLDVVRLESRLSDLLGRPVDLIEETALHPRVRTAAAHDLIHAF
ncbi:MAG: hypothetical protein R3349_08395 [Geminicoccaceae bacterium]|nr:hypothetical protein [Geminicoccaceae bacterium]